MKTRWKVAASCTVAMALSFLDQTAVNVALPSIQRELHLTSGMLHWVINAYLLLLAICLALGGKLGDRFERKHVAIIGIALFGFASVLCGLSQSGMALVMSRALQGIGGALMMPNCIAIVISLFPDNLRGKIMGTIMSFTAIFLILGPFVGGAITQYSSWHGIFWINLPISLIGCIMMLIYCPRLNNHKKIKINWSGFILFAIAITAIVYALMQGTIDGWHSNLIVTTGILGVIAFISFIYFQLKAKNPFIEVNLFKIGIFNRATAIYSGTQMAFILNVFLPIFFQSVLGLSPMETGTLSIVSLLPVMLLARYAGSLRDIYGPRLPMCIGLIFLTIGMLWLTLTLNTCNIWLIFPGMFGFSCAAPFIFGNANATALSVVPPQHRGAASGITTTCRQLGATISMAILSTIVVTTSHHATHLIASNYTVALSIAAAVCTLISASCLVIAMRLPNTHQQTTAATT